MANVQRWFEKFHSEIMVDEDLKGDLREKRDILVAKIRAYLKLNSLPLCEQYGQGSYSMGTGVVPAHREYDIDVGLMFPIRESDYSVKDVRKWVWEAVKNHTAKVEDRGPCVRVTYQNEGFHVDLVSYARWSDTLGIEQFRMAHKENGWRSADPPKLKEFVAKAREPFEIYKDKPTNTDQFRRLVRCLRRWIDEQYRGDVPGKPSGLGMVLLCKQGLQPTGNLDRTPDDRRALEVLATQCAGFAAISARKPTPEYEDLFGGCSGEQMKTLKDKFSALKDALTSAGNEADESKACDILRKLFGEDFKGPPAGDKVKVTEKPAIVTSSASG